MKVRKEFSGSLCRICGSQSGVEGSKSGLILRANLGRGQPKRGEACLGRLTAASYYTRTFDPSTATIRGISAKTPSKTSFKVRTWAS